MSRIVHVWCDWNRPRADDRRHKDASAAWARAFKDVPYIQCGIHEDDLKRNAKNTLGDSKALPYFKDLIDMAVDRHGSRGSDIILWSNDDVAWVEGAGPIILEAGMGWAWRRDFITLPRRITNAAILQGHQHPGADAFWFPLKAWTSLRRDMPDMLLGREAFDLIFHDLMKQHGGKAVANLLAHQMHQQEWCRLWDAPSSRHNAALAEAYIKAKGISELKYL